MLAAAKVLADQQCLVAAGCLDERTSSIVGGCWLLETLLGAMWATPLEAEAAVSCWRLQVASGPTALMAAAGCMVGRTSSIVGGCWLLGWADQQHIVAAGNGDMMMVVSLSLLKACA